MTAGEPLVLGIETSCDETGIGIVRGRTLLADAVASSVEEHARFGGVVPEVASRAHLEGDPRTSTAPGLVQQLVEQARPEPHALRGARDGDRQDVGVTACDGQPGVTDDALAVEGRDVVPGRGDAGELGPEHRRGPRVAEEFALEPGDVVDVPPPHVPQDERRRRRGRAHDCVLEAGLYLTAGTKVTLADGRVVKARELSGQDSLLFIRNSVTGRVEARARDGHGIVLNSALHAND